MFRAVLYRDLSPVNNTLGDFFATARRWHTTLARAAACALGGGSMIRFVLMVNKQGQTRLARYYEEQSGVSLQERSAQVYARLCLGRSGERACVHPG